MSPQSKREYVEAVYLRYKHATRSEKRLILDEFCATLGYHRKHAIRLLRKYKRFTRPKSKKRGPKPIYHVEALLKPLKKIWLAANLEKFFSTAAEKFLDKPVIRDKVGPNCR